MPAFDPDAPCPHNRMKKCSKVRHDARGCAKWLSMDFTKHGSGETVTEWGCTDFWGPVMSMQAAQESRGAAQATESFRNQMVRMNQEAKLVEHQLRNDPLLQSTIAKVLDADGV